VSDTTDAAALYPQRDSEALGEFYLMHVSAMTAEGLHSKSDIAAQLAWRDARIAELEAAIDRELAGMEMTIANFQTPTVALRTAINWHVSVALDPTVSSDAQALIDRGAALEARQVPGWVSVDSAMPASGLTVLACYRNRLGNLRRIRANWIAAKSSEATSDGDIGEYDEATDTYYDPEGWYEQIDNWGEYSAVAVCEGDITHWMPLPAAPTAPAPKEKP